MCILASNNKQFVPANFRPALGRLSTPVTHQHALNSTYLNQAQSVHHDSNHQSSIIHVNHSKAPRMPLTAMLDFDSWFGFSHLLHTRNGRQLGFGPALLFSSSGVIEVRPDLDAGTHCSSAEREDLQFRMSEESPEVCIMPCFVSTGKDLPWFHSIPT